MAGARPLGRDQTLPLEDVRVRKSSHMECGTAATRVVHFERVAAQFPAARVAAHLDDTWAVAVRAARTLHSMGPAGTVELQARASRPDIGGLLARQMLWQAGAHR